jgi:hypothetical protein
MTKRLNIQISQSVIQQEDYQRPTANSFVHKNDLLGSIRYAKLSLVMKLDRQPFAGHHHPKIYRAPFEAD